MSLAEYLNQLDELSFHEALTKCCASPKWVTAMVAARPFADDAEVTDAATSTWWQLKKEDWLTAFAAHPKIGDIDSFRAKFHNTQTWASGEQSGVAGASDETLRQLAQSNDEYLDRFGYIFIICATGKTADEMLAALLARLPNDPDTELRIAAGEQLKITLLRLQKLAP